MNSFKLRFLPLFNDFNNVDTLRKYKLVTSFWSRNAKNDARARFQAPIVADSIRSAFSPMPIPMLPQLRSHLRIFQLLACAATLCAFGFAPLRAQPIPMPEGGYDVNGIVMDAKGDFTFRETDAKSIEEARKKAMAPIIVNKDEKLTYVSLPRLTPLIKEMQLREKPVPEAYQYLGGMTQIRYVLAYPEERELVIVGPAEPWDSTNPVQPVGKVSGRPIIQLDDLVAAMRTARSMRRGGRTVGDLGVRLIRPRGPRSESPRSIRSMPKSPGQSAWRR